jgi:hypothetical protein
MVHVAVIQDIYAKKVRSGTAARAMDGVARRGIIVGQDASLGLGPAARQSTVRIFISRGVFAIWRNVLPAQHIANINALAKQPSTTTASGCNSLIMSIQLC